ncbi:potassium channel family protein [Desulfovibrio mangrovi]|uniref:potassium channel family protein n=1 Tax=Desulfovibrio mangrovi TaxID=2976983 RepID=UPI002245DA16|nr:potassium channel family protein [Desulfovibrio mangrovi]UZP68830.1 potassium channel family protein [Desulfovibrio mangrovi]
MKLTVKGKLSYLLVSQTGLLLLYPYLEGGGYATAALTFIFTAIMVFAVYAVSFKPIHLWITLGMGVPWLVISWIDVFAPIQNKLLLVSWYGLMCVFYCYVAAVILAHVLRAKVITMDIICGAVSVYIFIGLFFFILHGTVETIYPGAYITGTLPSGTDHITWPGFLYFSFVTLATLGYGDIVPLASQARSLAIIESVVGVFYVAILIARLVAAQDWRMRDEGTDGPRGWSGDKRAEIVDRKVD